MPKQSFENPVRGLRRLGQAPWLDFISRDILTSGELKRLISRDGVTGVTTNPSIFEKAISSSAAYDADIKRLSREGKAAEEICDALTATDVARAAGLLKGVYGRSQGRDGFVSLEVSPHCAYDSATTVDCARRIFSSLGKKNVLIKVPATEAGCAAIEELLAEGVNVNATLIFSLTHYQRVARAYFNALQKRQERGLGLKEVHSVASVFVSRIDTAVDRIIDQLAIEGANGARVVDIWTLKGRAAVANSASIYQSFRTLLRSDEFLRFKAAGARPQKIVWGSTSTKDPAYSDIKYVTELVGRQTVNTIPLATLKAFQDHGVPAIALKWNAAWARGVLDQLAGLGIDMNSLCQQIQDDGVKAFVESYDNLLAAIEKKRRKAVDTRRL
ncbi:MAG: transaldolase [Chloroflexi bacterium]|nr:transaldolase [Chloroflexota bacterium]